MKGRRVVEYSGLVKRRGPVKLWAYGYPDLAELFGMKEGAVRQAVVDGRFEPGKLVGVVGYWMELVVKMEKREKARRAR